MPVSTRLIRRRIKSVTNTRKITKAMELVAASKMKKAVQLTLSSRDYAGTARAIVDEILHYVDPATHALLTGMREDGTAKTSEKLNTLVIVCSSDRGLCGGFNTHCLKKTLSFLKQRSDDDLKIITIGKKVNGAVKRSGYDITATFESISNAPSFAGSKPIGSLVVQEFIEGSADRVFIVFMDYKSALTQIPTVEQILPLIPEDEIQEALKRSRKSGESDISFEPDPSVVLNKLLPKLVETRVYQALLESSASEHSSRMMAMRSATDNATNMIDDLTLTYNQARQAGITQEISEISAGKAALE